MKPTRRSVLCYIVLFLIICTTVPVSANSAQRWYHGVDSSGAILADEESPIVVEHELLTLHIPEFPLTYYRNKSDYLDYNTTVTAEYTFYNPSDYTITAKLLFPFGTIPDYANHFDITARDRNHGFAENASQYSITVNNQDIKKELRHTLSYSYSQFDLEKDLAKLYDGYMPDDFFTPDLKITKYTYSISGINKILYPAANAAFDIDWDDNKNKILFAEQSGFHSGTRLSAWASNDDTMTVYVFGEMNTPITWKFYKDGGVEDGEEIPGDASLVSTETFTFEEWALSEYSEDSGIRITDWYNAVIADLYLNDISERVLSSSYSSQTPPLMCWYEYEITLKPQERIVNRVTAPLYPAIDTGYDPAIYNYTYLLSPAKTWKEFGSLEIIVDTPYYMTESVLPGFEKTETGYCLTCDSLPDSELEFTLCSVETPAEPTYSSNLITIKILLAICVGVLCIIVLPFILIYKLVKRKKRLNL